MNNPPASSLEQLFALESVFEKAFSSILESAGITNVYITRESATFVTPCVDVTVIIGDVNKLHQAQPNANMPAFYDCWDSTLRVTVKSNRGTNGPQHSVLCGKVRAALNLYSLVTSFAKTDGAKFHSITDIREQRGDTAFDDLSNVDTTVIPFYFLPNIRPECWPVST